MKSEKNPFIQSLYNCMNCYGIGLKSKGKICKKCNGTGKMPIEIIERVKLIVKAEVTNIIKAEVPLYVNSFIMNQSMLANFNNSKNKMIALQPQRKSFCSTSWQNILI